MCNNTFNIKVVEGNAFPLIVRLQALSYEAVPPIAEPIDYTRLTDCVLKVGGVEYEVEITEDGVRAIMPATLALGDYNVVFTAKYEGSDIRAAYLRAITIVKWNEQSNAGECLLGSPVVLPAAVVIGGTLTDAELDELKDEFREKNAQLAQAIEDAEAAKAEWERKAAELDDVAQQSTLTSCVQALSNKIDNINIDTSDLAKQGTNPNATNTAILQAALNAGACPALVAQCYDILIAKGVNIPVQPSDMDMAHLPETIDQINKAFVGYVYCSTLPKTANVISAKKYNFSSILFPLEVPIGNFFSNDFYAEEVEGLTFKMSDVGGNFLFDNCASLKRVIANIDTSTIITNSSRGYWFTRNATLQYLSIRGITFQSTNSILYSNPNLQWLDISNSHILPTLTGTQSASFLQLPLCETLVGDETIDSVITNNICVLEGSHLQYNFTNMPLLNRQSLRAVINGLADLTGESAQTFTLGATLLAKLTADDIAVATNKNWNLA